MGSVGVGPAEAIPRNACLRTEPANCEDAGGGARTSSTSLCTTKPPGLPGVFYVGIPEYQDVADRCTEQLSSVIARELGEHGVPRRAVARRRSWIQRLAAGIVTEDNHPHPLRFGRTAATYHTCRAVPGADRCGFHRRPGARRARCATRLRPSRRGRRGSDPWPHRPGRIPDREPAPVHAGCQRYPRHERRVREKRVEMARPAALLGRCMGGAGFRSRACGLRAACRTAHRDA